MDDRTRESFSLDAKLFLGFVVAGIASMALLKWVGAGQVWITSVVAGLVVVYSVSVVRYGRLHLRLDQAGDNAYYLGLVFTLCSMAWALYEIGRLISTSTGGGSATEAVIGNFGLALITTLMGIICRIVLHQMRIDPADVEQESRLQLAQASSRMVAVLTDVSYQFTSFVQDLQQRQRDQQDEMAKLQKEARNELRVTLDSAAEGARAAMAQAAEGVSAAILEMVEATRQETSAFVAAAERLREIEPPPGRLNRRFGELASKVEALDERLGNITGSLGDTVTAMADAAAGVKQAGAALAEIGPSLANRASMQEELFGAQIESVKVTISGLGATVAKLVENGERMATGAERSAAAVDAAEKSAVEVLDRLTGVVQKVDASVAAMAATRQ